MREAQGGARRRGAKIVGGGALVGIAAWLIAPAVFVCAFLGLFVLVLVAHRRAAARLHRGFLTWCATRGLTHVAGQVASLHPKAPGTDPDVLGRDALQAAIGGRASVQCQVRGRLWAASRDGHISAVRVTRTSGKGGGVLYLVVDVPLEPRDVAAAGTELQRLGKPDVHTGSERLAAIVEGLTGVSTDDDLGAATYGGRYVAWFPAQTGFQFAAREAAVAAGELPARAGSTGADVILDDQLARIRDHHRRTFGG